MAPPFFTQEGSLMLPLSTVKMSLESCHADETQEICPFLRYLASGSTSLGNNLGSSLWPLWLPYSEAHRTGFGY